jgi:hypothetical protein
MSARPCETLELIFFFDFDFVSLNSILLCSLFIVNNVQYQFDPDTFSYRAIRTLSAGAQTQMESNRPLSLVPTVAFSSLPSELHGLIYSCLAWQEKMVFMTLSKEISSLSRSYREMRLNKTFSLEYALNESFRDRVSSLASPCHVDLNLSWDDQITDELISHLGNVRMINLSFCKQITDAGLAHLGNVKEIHLSSCHQITDEGLRHLGNGKVQILDLYCCHGFTDAGLAHIGNVKEIDLSCCHQITDEGLRHLGNGKVQILNFYSCHGLTDAGLAHIGNVKKINLSSCHQITDEGLRHLGNGQVQILNLSSCHGFTDAGLAHLGNVKEIDISWCSQITDERFTYLRDVLSLKLHR